MENRADIKRKNDEEDKYALNHGDVVGSFVIQSKLGKGKAGGAVYTALRIGDADTKEVALKFPSNNEELDALREINSKAPNCIGVTRLIAWGHHTTGKASEKPFVVISMLKGPITEFFEKLKSHSLQNRWYSICILGRMLVRTLEAMHRCGIVHCDMQPSNIVTGTVGITCPSHGFGLVQLVRPFLVDFGCARPHPGGKPMRADWGSVDFNSISAAQHGSRSPWDDLESLGWVLLHALWGELPWFEITRDSVSWHGKGYWELHRSWRCGQVGRIKEALLKSGAEAYEPKWRHLLETPPELIEFLQICHRRPTAKQSKQRSLRRDSSGEVPPPPPDYQALLALLGSSPDVDSSAADRQDMQLYWRYVENLGRQTSPLDLPEPAAQEMPGELVPPATVVRWLEEHSCVFIDCRPGVLYRSCTLPGAINIAPGDANWGNPAVKEHLAIIEQMTKPIVCFGADSSSHCASVCRSLAQGRGFPEGTHVQQDRLFQLDGGIEAWMAGQFSHCEPGGESWKVAFKSQRQAKQGAQSMEEPRGPEINGLDGERGLGGFAAMGRQVFVRSDIGLEGVSDSVVAQSQSQILGFDTAAERYAVQLEHWAMRRTVHVKAEDLMLREPTGPLWEIIGGAERGGIIVRSDEDFLSGKLEERLSFGAVVLEIKQNGKRLKYRLSVGTGPKEGWISTSLEDKILARRLS